MSLASAPTIFNVTFAETAGILFSLTGMAISVPSGKVTFRTGKSARIFEKGTFGSVALAEYAKEYDEVALCGVCTDICVVSNALLIKAFSPETAICCVTNACAGTSPAAHEAALATMRSCQVQTVSSAHLLIR